MFQERIMLMRIRKMESQQTQQNATARLAKFGTIVATNSTNAPIYSYNNHITERNY